MLLDDEKGHNQLSQERWGAVDKAIDLLLHTEAERARTVLRENRALHAALVDMLLEKKVLDATALASLRPALTGAVSGAVSGALTGAVSGALTDPAGRAEQ